MLDKLKTLTILSFDDFVEVVFRRFFTEEKGSISVTEAVCLTHRSVFVPQSHIDPRLSVRVDISDRATKVLLNGFVESVKSLADFADAGEEEKEKEFRQNKVHNINFVILKVAGDLSGNTGLTTRPPASLVRVERLL